MKTHRAQVIPNTHRLASERETFPFRCVWNGEDELHQGSEEICRRVAEAAERLTTAGGEPDVEAIAADVFGF